jgi:Type II transport protein GspH
LARRKPLTGKGTKGFSTIETLFAAATLVTLGGVATPPLRHAADTLRAAGAARYVATRFQRTRMEAVTRSADVAVRFTPSGSSYTFGIYVDGNRNGVLKSDVLSGVDWRLGAVERLPDNFPGVDFGALPGLPPVDAGGTQPGSNPIRLGASASASFSALGSSSTGTVYIRGAGNQQLAVRIYGETGKTRVMKFDNRTRKWNPL